MKYVMLLSKENYQLESTVETGLNPMPTATQGTQQETGATPGTTVKDKPDNSTSQGKTYRIPSAAANQNEITNVILL